MNDEELNALFKRAREARPDTARAEYGFETRLLARIRAERDENRGAGWAWRLSPFFAGVVMALGAWTYCLPLQIDLQAIATSGPEDLQVVEYFTGDKI